MSQQYERLSDDEARPCLSSTASVEGQSEKAGCEVTGESTHNPSRRKFHTLISCTFVALLVFIIGAATITYPYTKQHSRVDEHGIIRKPCGSSAAEAKALGCTFDPLSFCWLPDECLNPKLTEKFRAAGPWVYYTDQKKTETITEEFGQAEEQVWLTNRLHKNHCAFS
jgi:hypothetical protein